MKAKKKSDVFFMVVFILFIVWFLFSFVDVNLHNMTGGNYSKYNMFVLFYEKILSR